ncbi:MAG: V-type ATP synthase subunit D [Spirochaetales bacterium]|nr:V-type ATP synthase subunit D [Spirochaetales bacterium]MBP7262747.1 V-type ATP synthase subunit D [Spirochaetia bacterium]
MRNVPPTKTNLLKLRDELAFAQLGRELLDQKRGILVAELLAVVDQAAAMEKRVDEALAGAWSSLEDAALSMGRLRLLSLSGAVTMDASVDLRTRRVMGVNLPVVDTRFSDRGPYYSSLGADFRVDTALAGFREALTTLGRFAELKVSITRLAAEVRKTIRKVNALEKVALPDLEETLAHIGARLEENDRDMFALMKTVKGRLAGRMG